MRSPVSNILEKKGASMMKRHLTIHKTILSIVAIVLIMLSGCGMFESAELHTLDHAASVLPPLTTGREIERFRRDKGETFSKTIYPRILIVYEPINNHTKQEVYEEIVTMLKQHQWQGREPLAPHDYFEATLNQNGFEILTYVAISEGENILTLTLEIH